MQVETKVTGLKDLEKALFNLDLNIAKKILNAGVKAGTTVAKKQAQATAPIETGELKRSLQVKRAGRKQLRYVKYKVQAKPQPEIPNDKGGQNWRKLIQAEYGRVGQPPSHPFMAQALLSRKDEVVGKVKTRLKARIDKENKRVITK